MHPNFAIQPSPQPFSCERREQNLKVKVPFVEKEFRMKAAKVRCIESYQSPGTGFWGIGLLSGWGAGGRTMIGGATSLGRTTGGAGKFRTEY